MSERTKRFSLILSGCGVQDGSEIHEAVILMLALDNAGVSYQCFAPDMEQHRVVDHLTGHESSEVRNVLRESARIARGEVEPLSKLQMADFDGLVLPGGYGVGTNLSTYALSPTDCIVNSDLARVITQAHAQGKPIGAMCLAPILLARLIPGARITLGDDQGPVAIDARGMGAQVSAPEGHLVQVDVQNKLYTVPCYMRDVRPSQIFREATALVELLLQA